MKHPAKGLAHYFLPILIAGSLSPLFLTATKQLPSPAATAPTALFATDDSLSTDSLTLDSLSADSLQRPWPLWLSDGLDSLLQDDIFERTQLGLYVYDLTADSALYRHGHRQLLRPASVEKLVTSISALHFLGGGFQFLTRLYTNGCQTDTVFTGDLYLKGGFDPRFSYDDMSALVEALHTTGIRRIEGRIFTDLSIKDTLKWGEGWCWDDDEIMLKPLLYSGEDCFMEKFFEQLDEAGIAHPTEYAEKMIPADSTVMLVERNHTIDQILMRLLKESDNNYAESLFYQMGILDGATYPSARAAAKKIGTLISDLGLNPNDYYIADGSGLSLYNYVTPELIVSLLRYAWQRDNIFEHLYPALPIAGEDGTLEKRMRNSSAHYNVHAKTGTVRSVSTLAGYATASNDHLLAFCIMNQGIRTTSIGHRFQDKVCKLLTR